LNDCIKLMTDGKNKLFHLKNKTLLTFLLLLINLRVIRPKYFSLKDINKPKVITLPSLSDTPTRIRDQADNEINYLTSKNDSESSFRSSNNFFHLKFIL
jgi:hypothetical protein